MRKRFLLWLALCVFSIGALGAVFIDGQEVIQRVQLIASGYINWGAAGGSSGYGVRDNSGAIEVKNSGGSWAGLLGVSGWTDDGTVVRLTTITDTVGVGTVAPVSQVDVTKTAIGVTPVDTNGIRISNTTAAAAGAQQYSPPLVMQGQGWKTDATAASQKVEFMADVRPVQGAAAPTGYWGLYPSIADGAYSATPAVAVTSAGFMGVGTASPASTLHLSKASYDPLYLDRPSNNIDDATSVTARLKDSTSVTHDYGRWGAGIESNTDGAEKGYLLFHTANPSLAEKMRLTASGHLVIGSTTADARFHAELDSATTNAAVAVGRLSVTSTGTPAAGLGAQWQFEVETAAGAPGNQEVVAVIDGIATVVTPTAEVGALVFKTMRAGAAATERFRSDGNSSILLPLEDDAATPTLAFGDGDTGFYELTDDRIIAVFGGLITSSWLFDGTRIEASYAGGAYLKNDITSATLPVLSFKGDLDTGIGKAAADQLSLIAGGVEAMRFTEATGVLQSSQANVGLTADVGSAQGNGVITSSYNVYTTVGTAGDAATLPAVAIVGTIVVIKNDAAANAMDVFPASGDDLGEGANTALSLAAGKGAMFLCVVADSTWTNILEGI